MNNTTRKELAGLLAQVSEAFTGVQLDDLKAKLETLKERSSEMASEEEDKYGNLSEGLQASERGSALQEAAENLNAISEACQEALDAIDTLEEKTDEVKDHDVP